MHFEYNKIIYMIFYIYWDECAIFSGQVWILCMPNHRKWS